MSNKLSELKLNEEAEECRPYCIWYPDFASEETYRALAARCPYMRYQVGRACAAAGYSTLYAELDILPEASIAEEARESTAEGSHAIYESIMAAPVRYSVMDDYTLTIHAENPVSPARLNGDTDVRWKLEERVALGVDQEHPRDKVSVFPCIEEDRRLDLDRVGRRTEYHQLGPAETKLLYEPLPPDLPTVKKDFLIQMAAYEGNIDRYARLARPRLVDRVELACVIRGIYHHTMFARWWASEIESSANTSGRTWNPQMNTKALIWTTSCLFRKTWEWMPVLTTGPR
jgi:hypothetical protein